MKNDKFVYKIYDKRDDFPFEIVNYPNLTGNICASNAYGVYIGRLRSIALVCMLYSDFIIRSKQLITKLEKQHFSRDILIKKTKILYKRHVKFIEKYDVDVKQFVMDLFT